MQYLHLSRMLSRQARELTKAGKKGERAVATYEMIVDSLRHAGTRDDAVFCKRTKKGEQRMKNCVKYDLGGGYRLITVRSGEHLFIPFLGDHDATDVWFDRHRYDSFQPDESVYECEKIAILDEGREMSAVFNTGEESNGDIYEEELLARLDDSTLKAVFRGLYSNQSANTQPQPHEG